MKNPAGTFGGRKWSPEGKSAGGDLEGHTRGKNEVSERGERRNFPGVKLNGRLKVAPLERV